MSDYQAYLQSDEWKIKRQLAIQQAGGRCRICNSDGPLHIHHRSYARKGKPDEVLDLIAICSKCHDLFHKRDEINEELDNLRREVDQSCSSEELQVLKIERLYLIFALISRGEKLAFELLNDGELCLSTWGLPVGASNLLNLPPDIHEWHERWSDISRYNYQDKLINNALEWFESCEVLNG